MAKPSIFSKEYEKRMKKRKRKFLIVFLIIFVLIALMIVKISYNSTNYTNIKQKIQAWIDSDTIPNDNVDVVEENVENGQMAEEEISKAPEEKSLEIKLKSGTLAKAMYVKENGENKFTTLEGVDKLVEFDISPSGKQILVLDTDQSINVYNIDGSVKLISKNEYTSKKGDVFTKEATLRNQPQYMWNSTPKFINDEDILFISNRPYFGTAAVKQYLWITNIINDVDSVKWDLSGTNIEIGEREEKGIKITIDGNIYYVANDGNITQ